MEVKDFEKMTIEKENGKRIITIDGEKMDLSNVTEINISLSVNECIAMETTTKALLRW